MGNYRYPPADSQNERRRSASLARTDATAHRRRLAHLPDRKTHAVELQGLNGLSFALTTQVWSRSAICLRGRSRQRRDSRRFLRALARPSQPLGCSRGIDDRFRELTDARSARGLSANRSEFSHCTCIKISDEFGFVLPKTKKASLYHRKRTSYIDPAIRKCGPRVWLSQSNRNRREAFGWSHCTLPKRYLAMVAASTEPAGTIIPRQGA
jgi:hypothetical protein